MDLEKETQMLNSYWERVIKRTGAKLPPPYVWRADYLREFTLGLARDKRLVETLNSAGLRPSFRNMLVPDNPIDFYSGGLSISLYTPQPRSILLHPGIVRLSRDTEMTTEGLSRTIVYAAGLVQSHLFYCLRDIALEYMRFNPGNRVPLSTFGFYMFGLISEMINEEDSKPPKLPMRFPRLIRPSKNRSKLREFLKGDFLSDPFACLEEFARSSEREVDTTVIPAYKFIYDWYKDMHTDSFRKNQDGIWTGFDIRK